MPQSNDTIDEITYVDYPTIEKDGTAEKERQTDYRN